MNTDQTIVKSPPTDIPPDDRDCLVKLKDGKILILKHNQLHGISYWVKPEVCIMTTMMFQNYCNQIEYWYELSQF